MPVTDPFKYAVAGSWDVSQVCPQSDGFVSIEVDVPLFSIPDDIVWSGTPILLYCYGIKEETTDPPQGVPISHLWHWTETGGSQYAGDPNFFGEITGVAGNPVSAFNAFDPLGDITNSYTNALVSTIWKAGQNCSMRLFFTQTSPRLPAVTARARGLFAVALVDSGFVQTSPAHSHYLTSYIDINLLHHSIVLPTTGTTMMYQIPNAFNFFSTFPVLSKPSQYVFSYLSTVGSGPPGSTMTWTDPSNPGTWTDQFVTSHDIFQVGFANYIPNVQPIVETTYIVTGVPDTGGISGLTFPVSQWGFTTAYAHDASGRSWAQVVG